MNYDHLVGATIQLNEHIEDMEGYVEENMRATIKSIVPDRWNDGHDDDGQVWKITLDYTLFEEYNRAFESANYFGVVKLGQNRDSAEYTARQTGHYNVTEELYFPGPNVNDGENWSFYFEVLPSAKKDLMERFTASGTTMSYVEWLESQITE